LEWRDTHYVYPALELLTSRESTCAPGHSNLLEVSVLHPVTREWTVGSEITQNELKQFNFAM